MVSLVVESCSIFHSKALHTPLQRNPFPTCLKYVSCRKSGNAHCFHTMSADGTEDLAKQLINAKVWWHQRLTWRNSAARCAVFYTFMFEGCLTGIWSLFLVDIKDKLILTDSQLGIAVLFVYLGIVAVSPVAAVSLRNLGSQVSTFIGAVGLSIMLPFIPCASTFLALIATMFVYGFAMGLMDISMNSSAILTEIVAGKPLLGAFHGSYSVAAAVGSVIGGALKAQQYSIYSVFDTASLLSVVLTVLFLANVYNFKQEEIILDFQRKTNASGNRYSNEETASLVAKEAQGNVAGYGAVEAAVDDVAAAQTTSTRLIAYYSMVGFLAAFGESGIVTWSIVYFNKEIHASEMAKPLGFTCFMVCMALGRFGCDHLRGSIGRRCIVRIGGILASLGLLLLVFAPGLNYSVLVACVGLSVTGLGLSTLIPTMLSSAGHIPGGAHAGTSIAIVSMFTNSGAIVSSPLLGMMSDGLGSMRLAFFCNALFLFVIFGLSWGIPPETSGHSKPV